MKPETKAIQMRLSPKTVADLNALAESLSCSKAMLVTQLVRRCMATGGNPWNN